MARRQSMNGDGVPASASGVTGENFLTFERHKRKGVVGHLKKVGPERVNINGKKITEILKRTTEETPKKANMMYGSWPP